MTATDTQIILFFDGVCNLCQGCVRFLIGKKIKKPIFYASLQGDTARARLPMDLTQRPESLVVWHDGLCLKKSAGVFFLLENLDQSWLKIFLVFQIFPQKFCDAVYDVVAKNRYRLFGQKDSCRLPTEDEKKLFLP